MNDQASIHCYVCLLILLLGGAGCAAGGQANLEATIAAQNTRIAALEANSTSGSSSESTPGSTTPVPLDRTYLNSELALRLLYGNNVDVQRIVGSAEYYVLRNFDNFEPRLNPWYTRLLALLPTDSRDSEPATYFAITATGLAEGCGHICQATIGGAIFKKEQDKWRLDIEKESVASVGTFGNVPRHEIVEIGSGRWGMLFHNAYARGDYTEKWSVLVAAVDYDGLETVDVLLTFDAGFDNQQYCGPEIEPCHGYDATVQFLSGEHPTHYDAHVTTSGSRLEDGVLVNFEETDVYTFEGHSYQLVGE